MEMPRRSGAFEEGSSPIRVLGAARSWLSSLHGQNLHLTRGLEAMRPV